MDQTNIWASGFIFSAMAIGCAWLARESVAYYDGSSRIRAAFVAWYSAALALCLLIALHPAWLLPARVIPLGVASGTLALTLLSRTVTDATSRKTSQQRYRLQTVRIYFGLLILASSRLELVPPVFASAAGIGDLVVGGLALFLARTGTQSPKVELLFTAFGMVDLLNALRIGLTVVVPWLSTSHRPGVLLMLPFFAVPVLMSHHIQVLLRGSAVR